MFTFGAQFIFYYKDYYDLIVDKNSFLLNLLIWLVVCIVVLVVILLVSLIRKVRHEFKHTMTLIKKWLFNIMELLYIPILANIIPFGACTIKTAR